MTSIEYSTEVDASAEVVWKVTSDPRNLPRWDKHIVSVGLPDEALGPGAPYEVVMRFMAVRATVHAEVLEWEPPHRARVHLAGLLDAIVTTSVSSLSADRSMLRHEVEYRFRGPFGELGAASLRAVGGAQLALKRGVLAQKKDIEAQV